MQVIHTRNLPRTGIKGAWLPASVILHLLRV
jgi:hypothetical protein